MSYSLRLSIVILFFWGCTNKQSTYKSIVITNPNDLKAENIDGQMFDWKSTTQNVATAFIFISPECPLCENYTVSFKALKNEFEQKGIQLIGVVPGGYYSTDEVKVFLKKYKLDMDILMDTSYTFCSFFKAKVTPEVFLVDQKGETIYEGKIDNWMYALGIKKRVPTEFYLKNAIEATLNNTEILIKKTEAVGCIIE